MHTIITCLGHHFVVIIGYRDVHASLSPPEHKPTTIVQLCVPPTKQIVFVHLQKEKNNPLLYASSLNIASPKRQTCRHRSTKQKKETRIASVQNKHSKVNDLLHHKSRLRNDGLALAPLGGRTSLGRGGRLLFTLGSRAIEKPSLESDGLPCGVENGERWPSSPWEKEWSEVRAGGPPFVRL